MRPPLEPPTPAQIAWAAGYRAGFYPDDFESIPDALDGLTEWIEGYFAGCAAKERYCKMHRMGRKLNPRRGDWTIDRVTGEWI